MSSEEGTIKFVDVRESILRIGEQVEAGHSIGGMNRNYHVIYAYYIITLIMHMFVFTSV